MVARLDLGKHLGKSVQESTTAEILPLTELLEIIASWLRKLISSHC